MRRETLTVPLEVKDLQTREFDGYGSFFGNEDLGGDVVLPGAFKRSLAEYAKKGMLPLMFWMHDPAKVPGKWLDMHEDDTGLAVKGTLAKTPLGDEIHVLLGMKAVRGLSIGFRTIDWDYDDEGRRLLKELELWEVSPVSLPMNPLAQVAHAKSQLSAAGEYVPTAREFERFLRDGGCSHQVAKRIISALYQEKSITRDESINLRDADNPEDEDIARKLSAIADTMQASMIRLPRM